MQRCETRSIGFVFAVRDDKNRILFDVSSLCCGVYFVWARGTQTQTRPADNWISENRFWGVSCNLSVEKYDSSLVNKISVELKRTIGHSSQSLGRSRQRSWRCERMLSLRFALCLNTPLFTQGHSQVVKTKWTIVANPNKVEQKREIKTSVDLTKSIVLLSPSNEHSFAFEMIRFFKSFLFVFQSKEVHAVCRKFNSFSIPIHRFDSHFKRSSIHKSQNCLRLFPLRRKGAQCDDTEGDYFGWVKMILCEYYLWARNEWHRLPAADVDRLMSKYEVVSLCLWAGARLPERCRELASIHSKRIDGQLI